MVFPPTPLKHLRTVKMGSSSPIFGMKNKNMFWNHHLVLGGLSKSQAPIISGLFSTPATHYPNRTFSGGVRTASRSRPFAVLPHVPASSGWWRLGLSVGVGVFQKGGYIIQDVGTWDDVNVWIKKTTKFDCDWLSSESLCLILCWWWLSLIRATIYPLL